MQQRFCSRCGAALSGREVICPRCGSVISQQRYRPQSGSAPAGTPRRQQSRSQRPQPRPQRPQPRPQPRPAPRYEAPPQPMPQPVPKKRAVSKANASGRSSAARAKRERISRRIFALLTAAVVIAGIYIIIFTVQVFRVRISGYPYDTTMRLSHSNYGQAISSYFDEGKWSVNPFNAHCTYKGKSRHGDEYEIVFSAGMSVELESISINDRQIDEKLYEQKIMAMFI